LLHVRLRQAALPIPGSPFTLEVTPGEPSAVTTKLPMPGDGSAIRGSVGTGPDAGCELIVSTADKMGNVCVEGGADLKVECEDEDVETTVNDKGDGTYQLMWKSNKSGLFVSKVTINGEAVLASPARIKLSSTSPELARSDIFGNGLAKAVAGVEGFFGIAFVDAFGNHALPGDVFQFGMAMLKDREKLAGAKPYPFEVRQVKPEESKSVGRKGSTEGEFYDLSYVAYTAGACELHVWCDPTGKGERIAFPGSPFQLHVQAGRCSSSVSQVDGWTKESRGVDKHGKVIQQDTNKIIAGDNIFFRPQILDAYGNTAVLPENALAVKLITPDGKSTPLPYTPSARGGVTTYDVRYECTLRGPHSVHITLDGESIKGSPIEFDVLPAHAEPGMCKLVMPTEKVLYANTTATVLLETYDKFGNPSDSGGLATAARLQLQKQGVHDQTMLMPNNHTLETVDNGDGTYAVNITLIKIAATLKLIVNMDKNLPAAGGELPAVMLNFVKDEEAEKRLAEQQTATSPDSPGSVPAPVGIPNKELSKAGKQLKKSGEMVVEQLRADPRKKKDVRLMAADALAAGSAYQFGSGIKTYEEEGDGLLTQQTASTTTKRVSISQS